MGNERWRSFTAGHQETDLWIAVSAEVYTPEIEGYIGQRVLFYREILEEHIRKNPDFLHSLSPLKAPGDPHFLIREMYEASEKAGTGPMSSVAGVMAEHVCMDLISGFGIPEVVVENGGDIFMKITSPVTVSVYAGSSPLSGKLGMEIKPAQTPLSVCCSSGTVGHSYSFGVADACLIACRSGALADAWATAACNMVKNANMVREVADLMLQKSDIQSVVIIKDDQAGIGGTLEVKILK